MNENILNELEAEEVYNSALIEDRRTNQDLKNDIDTFIFIKRTQINKFNLIKYCGVSNADSETEGCARVNSVYVSKYGKSHIKKSKVMNPYGSISQASNLETKNKRLQKRKLMEFSMLNVKKFDISQFKS